MNATELMIGDLVYLGKRPIHVTAATFKLMFDDKKFAESLHPIPLTPEILEKNEFKEDIEITGCYWRSDCNKFCFVKEVDDWYFAIRYKGGHICIAMCNYVYKFQQILRNLLEIEKEVVL